MGNSNTLGAWGEEKAARFLTERGYTVLERNFHSRYGEIDLIAEDGEFLVFVEVKLRASVSHGLPEETVTPRKQEKLRLTAETYLQTHETNKQPRFDVVEIVTRKGRPLEPVSIDHFMAAYETGDLHASF